MDPETEYQKGLTDGLHEERERCERLLEELEGGFRSGSRERQVLEYARRAVKEGRQPKQVDFGFLGRYEV